jgi:hypothetical protein
MTDQNEPVTRLGPQSGGREPGDPPVHVYGWAWGPDDARRPGLPWIGIFLLVFGVLLLIQQAYPEFRSAGSVVVLAIGLAFLVRWVLERRTGSLYAGAIITALAAPGLVQAAGFDADGLTTFSLGIAFLFIAAVRAATGGGAGWQLWLGGLLAIVGGASIANTSIAGLLIPILLVALGLLLILRGSTPGRRFR